MIIVTYQIGATSPFVACGLMGAEGNGGESAGTFVGVFDSRCEYGCRGRV
jgi:hypothetical protein